MVAQCKICGGTPVYETRTEHVQAVEQSDKIENIELNKGRTLTGNDASQAGVPNDTYVAGDEADFRLRAPECTGCKASHWARPGGMDPRDLVKVPEDARETVIDAHRKTYEAAWDAANRA